MLPFFKDLNECAGPPSENTCHEHANCTNTPGAFKCKCEDGYYGNGVECLGNPLLVYVGFISHYIMSQ